MTSAVSHPFSRDPLKSAPALVASVPFPLKVSMAEAISMMPFCMFLLPIPTF
ncbi:hypothetical protein D3C75_1266630 [compost metagenome]